MNKVISLGMGVQSVAMYFMSSLEEMERADLAIFADPGLEDQRTYRYLNYLLDWQRQHNGIPVRVVRKRSLKYNLLSDNHRFISIPAFTNQGKGQLKRQCTAEYKIDQVVMGLREWYGLKPREWMPVTEVWLGITLDEILRMKPSQHPRLINCHPFIELLMRRSDCRYWLKEHQFPIPVKSACICCPFKSDRAWLELKTNEPEQFKEAVRIDRNIRLKKQIREKIYLHPSCQPLELVQFQPDLFQDTWAEECDGYCGL
jgi:hypothetical protein